jgi:hypothetical protein
VRLQAGARRSPIPFRGKQAWRCDRRLKHTCPHVFSWRRIGANLCRKARGAFIKHMNAITCLYTSPDRDSE